MIGMCGVTTGEDRASVTQRWVAKGIEGLPVRKVDQVGEGVWQGRRHDRRRWWIRSVGMRLGPDLLLFAPLGPPVLEPDLEHMMNERSD